jgi:hypothetical protein
MFVWRHLNEKKILLFLLSFSIISLSSCRSWREELLAPPEETEIPDGSLVATCEIDEVIHKYVYKNDGVYQYFIDGIEQNENSVDTIQEQAYLHNESVENYLDDEYGEAGCIIIDYVSEDFD